MGSISPVRDTGRPLLDVRLFGHARVHSDGEPIKLAKRLTSVALLALVLLQREQAMARESLAFTLFPEADEASALAELRRYLYLVNKSLPGRAEPWLLADADVVRWNGGSRAFVDVCAFDRLATDVQTYAAAMDLYEGDLLEDVYDDWVIGERERLRTRFLTIATESLEAYRVARNFASAIACAKRILVRDPWREDTLRALLSVRYESGDGAGALAEYDQFAKRLRDDLAIAPMPETIAVRQAIVRNEALPGALPVFATAVAQSSPRTLTALPFVGRRREREALYAAWQRAARGAGSFVLVTGEAGVGKTRLIAELARTVSAEGGRVLVGTTASSEAMPYQAIVAALRSGLPLLLARPPAAARRAILATLLPELAEAASAEFVGSEQPAETATARVYDALTHAVLSLGSPRPLLLILEDVHWAGPATIDALQAIVRNLSRAPILIVATSRDEETGAGHPVVVLSRMLHVFENAKELPLDRLLESDVAELVANVDALRDGAPDLAHELYAHSEGNALFLNEAISGVIERNDAPSRLPTTTIDAVLRARIERLSDEADLVAQIVAVAGAGADVALVRNVSNVSAAAVARGFDELLDRRLVREAGARAQYDYVFTHHLIAKAVYDAMEAALRASRHGRIARILSSDERAPGATSAREIARHYERAGEPEDAARWYVAAARHATLVHAYGDAIELAGRALALAEARDVCIAALDLRERANGRRGDRDAQLADIDRLDRFAASPRERFDVLRRRVSLARTLGESDHEGRFIGELELLADTLDDSARALALMERATHAGLQSRHTQAIPPALRALELYEHLSDVRGQLECLSLMVEFAANTGDVAGSRRYLALMRERAASVADQAVEAHALTVASIAALLRRDYRETFDLTARALVLHEVTNDRESQAAAFGRLAVSAAWLGEFATALREFDRALVAFESIANKRGLALTLTNRTSLLMKLGRFREALESIERANALYEITHEKRTYVCNLVNASFVRLQLGDPAEARELALRALDAAREIGFPVFEAAALANLGNAERMLGNPVAAIEHMRAGLALRRPLQEARDYVDDLADLLLAYAAAGQTRESGEIARELYTLGHDSFAGALWPHYVWWAVSRGFDAVAQPERALEAAARARAELAAFVGIIPDAETRAHFLDVPFNRAITSGA